MYVEQQIYTDTKTHYYCWLKILNRILVFKLYLTLRVIIWLRGWFYSIINLIYSHSNTYVWSIENEIQLLVGQMSGIWTGSRKISEKKKWNITLMSGIWTGRTKKIKHKEKNLIYCRMKREKKKRIMWWSIHKTTCHLLSMQKKRKSVVN